MHEVDELVLYYYLLYQLGTGGNSKAIRKQKHYEDCTQYMALIPMNQFTVKMWFNTMTVWSAIYMALIPMNQFIVKMCGVIR